MCALSMRVDHVFLCFGLLVPSQPLFTLCVRASAHACIALPCAQPTVPPSPFPPNSESPSEALSEALSDTAVPTIGPTQRPSDDATAAPNEVTTPEPSTMPSAELLIEVEIQQVRLQ